MDACIREERPYVPPDKGCSIGISVGSSSIYYVISALENNRGPDLMRQAVDIGRVKDLEDISRLIEKHNIFGGAISIQPEPQLIQRWIKRSHHYRMMRVILLNDGMSKPERDKKEKTLAVDRTYLLNSAYGEIREQRWLLPPNVAEIDGGEFYAQMKVPSRVRDLTSGELRYRWTETGALDHYRFAHAFDHLYAITRHFFGCVGFI